MHRRLEHEKKFAVVRHTYVFPIIPLLLGFPTSCLGRPLVLLLFPLLLHVAVCCCYIPTYGGAIRLCCLWILHSPLPFSIILSLFFLAPHHTYTQIVLFLPLLSHSPYWGAATSSIDMTDSFLSSAHPYIRSTYKDPNIPHSIPCASPTNDDGPFCMTPSTFSFYSWLHTYAHHHTWDPNILIRRRSSKRECWRMQNLWWQYCDGVSIKLSERWRSREWRTRIPVVVLDKRQAMSIYVWEWMEWEREGTKAVPTCLAWPDASWARCFADS